MSDKLKQAWDETERTGAPIKVGRDVVCDACGDDYTESDDIGGFIFGSSAYCPNCARNTMKDIKRYSEEHFIRARCPDGVSFADFVRGYRGPDAAVQVVLLPKDPA